MTNGQTIIYKIVHRKLKIGQHDPSFLKQGVYSSGPAALAAPAILIMSKEPVISNFHR